MPTSEFDQLPPDVSGSQPDADSARVPGEGMSGKGTSDSGKPDLSKYVPAEDLNKLRSKMDRQMADQKKQFDELQSQYKSLMEWREKNETEGLTDEELVAYQAEKSEYEAGRKIAEANQRSAQLEYERNVLQLKQYYLGKGAPQEIVNMDDPAAMQEAFLNHLVERAAKAEAALAKQGVTTDTKGKPAPTVTTHKPAAALGKTSWSKVMPGSKEEAEIFAKIEAGVIKPEDIEA